MKWSDGSRADAGRRRLHLQHAEEVPRHQHQRHRRSPRATVVRQTQVTINFSITAVHEPAVRRGPVYIVPQSIWSDRSAIPARSSTPTRSAQGPMRSRPFSADSRCRRLQPTRTTGAAWNVGGGAPAVTRSNSRCSRPTATVLSALETNQLDWAGNFITGLQQAFVEPDPTDHKVWFAPVQTNTLEPEPPRVADEPARRSPGGQPRDRPHGDQQAGRVRPRAGRDERQRHRAAELRGPGCARRQERLRCRRKANPKAADAVLARPGYDAQGRLLRPQGQGSSTSRSPTRPTTRTTREDDSSWRSELARRRISMPRSTACRTTAWYARPRRRQVRLGDEPLVATRRSCPTASTTAGSTAP